MWPLNHTVSPEAIKLCLIYKRKAWVNMLKNDPPQSLSDILHWRIVEAGGRVVLPSHLTYPFDFLASSIFLTSVFRFPVGQPGSIYLDVSGVLIPLRGDLKSLSWKMFHGNNKDIGTKENLFSRPDFFPRYFFNSPKLQKVKCLNLVLTSC